MRPTRTTRADAARRAKAAYEAGALTAQAPQPEARYHLRQGGRTYKCAVGALFSDDRARRVERRELTPPLLGYPMVGELLEAGVLDAPVEEDREYLARLQKLHDEWASSECNVRTYEENARRLAGTRDEGYWQGMARRARAGANADRDRFLEHVEDGLR